MIQINSQTKFKIHQIRNRQMREMLYYRRIACRDLEPLNQ